MLDLQALVNLAILALIVVVIVYNVGFALLNHTPVNFASLLALIGKLEGMIQQNHAQSVDNSAKIAILDQKITALGGTIGTNAGQQINTVNQAAPGAVLPPAQGRVPPFLPPTIPPPAHP